MEKTRSEKIKETLLAGFVIVCVVLIFMVWVSALSEEGVENPYFYRGEPEESQSFYTTGTAIAEQAALGTSTPTPDEKKHKEHTPTPSAIPFTPESDQ